VHLFLRHKLSFFSSSCNNFFLGRISEKPILDTSFIIQKNILALDVFLIRRIYVVVDFCDFYDF